MADSIRVGKSNATLLSDIMSIADIKDRRTAYQIIEELIVKHGYPIVASRKGEHKGYYIPANQKELEEAKRTFKNAIDSMNNRYVCIVNNYENTEV